LIALLPSPSYRASDSSSARIAEAIAGRRPPLLVQRPEFRRFPRDPDQRLDSGSVESPNDFRWTSALLSSERKRLHILRFESLR
jgi:hypothetical protein